MTGHAGVTRKDLVVVVVVVAVFATVGYGLIHLRVRAEEEARRIRCRGNLNQMAKGMATYLNVHGGGRWYPWPIGRGSDPGDFNGAEWLASLYWTGVVTDPGIYICPSTNDFNSGGRDLGSHRAPPGGLFAHTVSYAGLHYRSFTAADGSPKAVAADGDFPPNLPMACDDTEGPPHHGGGGLAILYFDTHIEYKTAVEGKLEGWAKGRPPWPLRN